MEIEVRPGLVSKDSEGKITCRPIFSRIVSLFAEQNELQFAVPGGLIGVYVVFSLQIILLNTIFFQVNLVKFSIQFDTQSPLLQCARYFNYTI